MWCLVGISNFNLKYWRNETWFGYFFKSSEMLKYKFVMKTSNFIILGKQNA